MVIFWVTRVSQWPRDSMILQLHLIQAYVSSRQRPKLLQFSLTPPSMDNRLDHFQSPSNSVKTLEALTSSKERSPTGLNLSQSTD